MYIYIYLYLSLYICIYTHALSLPLQPWLARYRDSGLAANAHRVAAFRRQRHMYANLFTDHIPDCVYALSNRLCPRPGYHTSADLNF